MHQEKHYLQPWNGSLGGFVCAHNPLFAMSAETITFPLMCDVYPPTLCFAFIRICFSINSTNGIIYFNAITVTFPFTCDVYPLTHCFAFIRICYSINPTNGIIYCNADTVISLRTAMERTEENEEKIGCSPHGDGEGRQFFFKRFQF